MITLAACTPPLANPYSYQDFRQLLTELVATNGTTGNEQSDYKIAATRLNLQRMKRVEKQILLLPKLEELLDRHQPDWNWVVLTEGWCSECAYLLPALAAITDRYPSIKLSILLRNQNLAWMNSCLTNGNPSIPKLVCLDADMCERLFTWGPRPALLQKQYLAYRAQHPELTTQEAARQLHSWYARDRSHTMQQDLFTLMEQLLYFTNQPAIFR